MLILVRCASESVTKSQSVRRRFQQRLMNNCRAAFRQHQIDARIEPDWGRFYVHSSDDRVLDVLGRIYGIHNFAVVDAHCESNLDAMAQLARSTYGERVRGRRFGISCKRSGKHDFSSQDVCELLGRSINYHHSAQVDLGNPDIKISVVIRGETTFLYSDRVFRGVGGLPLKTGGRALCLMSGGFDSPLAAWMMQKRGIEVSYLFLNLAGRSYERSVVSVTKKLVDQWSFGISPKFYAMDFRPLVEQIQLRVKPGFAQVALKRMFYLAADRLAAEVGADAIVTGEAIGQVSSQTLPNLRAIEDQLSRPVLRPLIAYDKEEIMAECRRIGTFELSSRIQEYCRLVPDRPVTAAKREAVSTEVASLDDALLDQALQGRRCLDLKSLTPSDLSIPYLTVDELLPGWSVLDCRDLNVSKSFPLAGSRWIDFYQLMDPSVALDRDQGYVVCCEVGTQSMVAAEHLQSLGYEAYSLRGGLKSVKN